MPGARAWARRLALGIARVALLAANLLLWGSIAAYVWELGVGVPGAEVAGTSLGLAPRLDLVRASAAISARHWTLRAHGLSRAATATQAGLTPSAGQIWSALQARDTPGDPLQAGWLLLRGLAGRDQLSLVASPGDPRSLLFAQEISAWANTPVQEPWVGVQGDLAGLRSGAPGYRADTHALAGRLAMSGSGPVDLPMRVSQPHPMSRADAAFQRIQQVLTHPITVTYRGSSATLDGPALASTLRVGRSLEVKSDLEALTAVVSSRIAAWDSQGDVLASSPHVSVNAAALARAVWPLLGRGGQLSADAAVSTALPASIELPVPAVQQDALDGCEAAAGSMLLQAKGISVSQDTISANLLRSSGDVSWDQNGNPIWGDPNLGFVGDPAGSGQAGWGGYAIYHAPFAAALAQYAPGRVADITGTDLGGLERELLAGNPVEVWATVDWAGHVPWNWTLPSGAAFEGDRGEHAVALTGVAPGGFYYNDPYYGTAGDFVSTALFQSVWDFMGRQAIALR